MMQRFLLDRIDAESTRSPIGRQHDLVLLPGPDKTQSLLPFLECAVAWAEVALDAAVLEAMPVFRRRTGLHGGIIIPRHPADGGRPIPGVASSAYNREPTMAAEPYLDDERLSTIKWPPIRSDACPHKTRGHPSVSEYFLPLQIRELRLFDIP